MKSWGRCSLKIMGLNYESLTASPGDGLLHWRDVAQGLNCGDSSVEVTGEFSRTVTEERPKMLKDKRRRSHGGQGAETLQEQQGWLQIWPLT